MVSPNECPHRVMRPIKLAIVSTHPVQYYAPVFRGLSRAPQLATRSFYTWSQTEGGLQHEPEFGTTVRWDIPLLEGYDHEFVANVAARPQTDGFFAVRTPSLVPRILEWGADAALVYGWNRAAHLGAMLALKRRMPVFFRGDSTLLDEQPHWRGVARRLLLRGIYSAIDVAIAVGTRNREYFRWCGVPDANIEVAPHSVDTVRFGADDTAREREARAWREQLGIPEGDLVVVFAGKFQPKKDPLILVEALRTMRSPRVHLVLFGGGPLADVITEQTRGMARIHVLPFQNQSRMPIAYRLGDVFVLPSRGPGETWGLALNEAMACARPVIASTRVGGASDLIVEGETGWRFPAGDAAALAAVFEAVAAMPAAELRRVGERARAHVQRWSTEECVRRMVDIITRRAGPVAA
jgi:glycosyltransferase involved in cell wall biosynthesis